MKKLVILAVCISFLMPAVARAGATEVAIGSVSSAILAAVLTKTTDWMTGPYKRKKWERNHELDNLERASRGLKPLDYCLALYREKRRWAKKEDKCQDRIESFEAGKAKALFPKLRKKKRRS